MNETEMVAGKTYIVLVSLFGIFKRFFGSVLTVAEDRISHVSKLHPDLVETPGLKLYFQKR